MDYPPNQSVWRRGWNDTKTVWTNWQFYLLDAVVAVVIGGIFQWYWGLFVVLFGMFCVWLGATASAPIKQRNEAKLRNQILEEERTPKLEVEPRTGRRQWDYENPHLMWVELQVTNTSPTLTLRNVEVQIASQIDILDIREGGRNAPIKHHLYDRGVWSRVTVLWSELDVTPPSRRIDIPPRGTKIALLAFQDNSNGQWTIYNALSSPKPMSLGGAKIEVEVSSIDSALWRKNYYIECHPNYTDGTLARFEFVEWDTWAANHDVIEPSNPDKEGSQT